MFYIKKEHKLTKDIELELAERKLRKEEIEMKKKGGKYLSKENAFAKYR